ncbi:MULTISPECIES: phosphate ABC transporter ATP-binding protein PstB [Pseudothermotoga]|jgi:phosphate transport system ATP-binding protein|uniref:Phosphate ABC transporter, ATPase subunit n=1 Tax=Pseudothermotoga lettingae (strain ATCC BAA-301 / DSM 14385 / NBRC 107922 / TMO) TaxID=416591 RepID=A8F7W9_PSELT|nr:MULTISPECIES: phosphate ABC transporter ATP-binding protein PstB [Pseudothermotoga]ABV34253.1 phosphate ABC transporter, ATPase subunit [Pseudothermotoga lettingae TMO]KUK21302.1 MAG: Phosphate ABC transporter, ATPase subunit [Pseudothermotoga lettingae]MDI3494961.1 phosphate transport system ATP-binding protein [Pseudothermotoga sp.]MDK2884859.1 phosphate transport system ATP-binding protein [Pseudothermotoga sp.]GLI48802.1 phosphate import ATP-binding protein PstB [Pseudothermotoga lettin
MDEIIFEIKDLCAYYDTHRVLDHINVQIKSKRITAIMGPSGCGKSTFLRCLNRLNDLVDGFSMVGQIFYRGQDIYQIKDLTQYRRKVTMVFQRPNPFPMSVFDNVAYGLRLMGIKDRYLIREKVENALKRAALWDEVEDKLKKPAVQLSGGQQQRLCIARALAVEPEVILLDEPTSALDPIATTKIERLLETIAEEYTVVIVTHSMGQALRISDEVMFLYQGRLVEYGVTSQIVKTPTHEMTRQFLTGKIG